MLLQKCSLCSISSLKKSAKVKSGLDNWSSGGSCPVVELVVISKYYRFWLFGIIH